MYLLKTQLKRYYTVIEKCYFFTDALLANLMMKHVTDCPRTPVNLLKPCGLLDRCPFKWI